MKKTMTLGVHDPGDDFRASLPADVARFFTNRLGDQSYFSFDEPDFSRFASLRDTARRAGREVTWTSRFDPEERPRDGRIYTAFANVRVRGAKLEWNGYIVTKKCAGCGKEYEEIDESARPELTLPGGVDRPPLFTTGTGILLSSGLVTELRGLSQPYLRGALLVDVGAGYSLLRSSIDLGLEIWDDSAARCGTCGRLRVSPGFFPLLARGPDADVYFSREHSPLVPILNGRLARALQGDEPDELTLWFTGWYPDDLDLARLPPS
jgi:hypothetical protein